LINNATNLSTSVISTVAYETTLVDRVSRSIRKVVNLRNIDDLPLLGRNVMNLFLHSSR